MIEIVKKLNMLVLSFVIISVSLVFNANAANYTYHVYNNYEDDLSCWGGWKKYHYGSTTATAKKGDIVAFPRSPEIIGGILNETGTWNARMSGYGYYSLEYNKHILGLLTYMKDRMERSDSTISNYETDYIPTPNSTFIFYEPYDEYGKVRLLDALKIAINGITASWYSGRYERGEFAKFWTGCFDDSHSDMLRKIQNKFYFKAYGESAHSLLTSMMGNYYNILTQEQKAVLKGVVLSVMEARYRNKNVQGKANLKITAAEGDLWPFLVNLYNLDKIKYDASSNRYIDTFRNETYYSWPTFDKIIEGVYQWLYYYDADTIRTTSHSTITMALRESTDDEEIEIDWEGEFMELTWGDFPYISGKELETFHSRCSQTKSTFKKSKANTEGIFGAAELYDITSDINFSEALEDMKTEMLRFANDVGGEIRTVFNGLDEYNIERSYVMAKNIVESNRVRNEYAYYDIGTNILTYTYGREGKEYMLMDFQKIKLKEPLRDTNDNWSIEDTDNDGILDRDEFGDDGSVDGSTEMWTKVDITPFIKKMVEKELYGNDTNAINNNQAHINEVLARVKYNIYNQRFTFNTDNIDNNTVNRVEDKEHNLNVDDDTKETLDTMTSTIQKQQYLQMVPSRLEVELYKYKSNPVLKDTDFDGIDDGYGYKRDANGDYVVDGNNKKIPVDLGTYKDKSPRSNFFKGRMHSTRISGDKGVDVDMNMDYRYFFMSNKLYYNELSTMSILYANSIYRRGKDEDGNWMDYHSGLQLKSPNNFITEPTRTGLYKESEVKNMSIDRFNNLQVKEMMEHFGFQNVKTYYMGERGDGTNDDPADGAMECREYKDTHKGKVAIGYKNIEYHGLNKTVIGIVIRGTAEDDDWDNDFDMGDKDLRNSIKGITSAGHENYRPIYENGDSNNTRAINEYLNSEFNKKYDHKYNTELTHFAYGYPDWTHQYHHAGFDIVSNRILEVVQKYYTENWDHFDDNIEDSDEDRVNNVVEHKNDNNNDPLCYWVMGHSMGGGVANLLASKLIDGYGNLGGNRDNVYCYTFAAPNTFYKTDNVNYRYSAYKRSEIIEERYREPKASKYRCIFNIVNDDDFVPKLPMEECEWTKYGRVGKKSLTNDIRIKYGGYTNRPIIVGGRIKRDYKNYLIDDYQTNLMSIRRTIESFSNMYEDKKNMRYASYQFVETKGKKDYAKFKNTQEYERSVAFYASPYQKYNKDSNGSVFQYQMPAYVMQSITNAIHDKFTEWKNENGMRYINVREQEPKPIMSENQWVFKHAVLANEKLQSAALEMLIGEGVFKMIDHPHYLESYYSLTKELSVNDFR